MNDLVRLAMDHAIRGFGGHDKVFNGAGFSVAMKSISCVDQTLDGRMVRAILTGRPDVEILAGGGHYRLIETAP